MTGKQYAQQEMIEIARAISEPEDHDEHLVRGPFRDLVRENYFALFGVE